MSSGTSENVNVLVRLRRRDAHWDVQDVSIDRPDARLEYLPLSEKIDETSSLQAVMQAADKYLERHPVPLALEFKTWMVRQIMNYEVTEGMKPEVLELTGYDTMEIFSLPYDDVGHLATQIAIEGERALPTFLGPELITNAPENCLRQKDGSHRVVLHIPRAPRPLPDLSKSGAATSGALAVQRDAIKRLRGKIVAEGKIGPEDQVLVQQLVDATQDLDWHLAHGAVLPEGWKAVPFEGYDG